MLSTIADYTRLTKDMGKSLTQVATQPDVSRDTEYFLSHIGNVKTIDDFLKDYRLYSYAMKAYGLSDMTYAKAFMRKVLTEGIADNKSFANKLTDTRYRQFAAAFNFAALGDKATQTAAAQTRHGDPIRHADDGGEGRRPERGPAAGALFHAQGVHDHQSPTRSSRTRR